MRSCVMDNSVYSTWKSERATFSHPANRATHNSIRQPVIHMTSNIDYYGISLIHTPILPTIMLM